MFPPVHVADIARHEGKEVTLHGWLHGRRSSGKLHFLQLRDGTGTRSSASSSRGTSRAETFEDADHLPQETSLAVTGLVKSDERSPSGSSWTSAACPWWRAPRASSRSGTRSTASPS